MHFGNLHNFEIALRILEIDKLCNSKAATKAGLSPLNLRLRNLEPDWLHTHFFFAVLLCCTR